MRTRRQIEEAFEGADVPMRDVGDGTMISESYQLEDQQQRAILEVLLDIRELLTERLSGD